MLRGNAHGVQIDDGERIIRKELASNNGGGFFAAKPLELTLSYLCDYKTGRLGVQDENQVINPSTSDSKWIEKDFFTKLNPNPPSYSKWKLPEEEDAAATKKHKLESALNLSLALPSDSANCIPLDSDDLSVSFYTYSHNLSCSLTRNSDTFDHMFCEGEGTNGSVHSRFRPVGETVKRVPTCVGKESWNDSHDRSLSFDNVSFLPSELPAKCLKSGSGESRKLEFEDPDEGRGKRVSKPERFLYEIVSESIPTMTRIINELPQEVMESTKKYLKNVICLPEKKNELIKLQIKLERRSDLRFESLLKCHRDQLQIMVSIKTGLENFVSDNSKQSIKELIDIFLFRNCRNVNCNSVLPVDDCECKICSGNKGFCSSCMCPICMKFDCASNTCSWVGCDACSHWCHAICGLEKNLIRPGCGLNGESETSEMLFNCIACNHTSEMFGFVKDVFVCCAKDWGSESLKRELEVVKTVFKGSKDHRGMQLHMIAEDLFSKLGKKILSSSAAREMIIQFFNNGGSDLYDPKLCKRKSILFDDDAVHLSPKFGSYSMKDVIFNDSKVEENGDLDKLLSSGAFGSLESIILVKEAEALMFQSKADKAREEALTYKQMIMSQSEKLEEHELRLSKLCLKETEARKKRKLEELKMLENSQTEYYILKQRMQSEIAPLLKIMKTAKEKWN